MDSQYVQPGDLAEDADDDLKSNTGPLSPDFETRASDSLRSPLFQLPAAGSLDASPDGGAGRDSGDDDSQTDSPDESETAPAGGGFTGDPDDSDDLASRRTGLFSYLRHNGIATTMRPDGQERVNLDGDGNPLFDAVKSPPYKGEDGRWKNTVLDPNGVPRETDLSASAAAEGQPPSGGEDAANLPGDADPGVSLREQISSGRSQQESAALADQEKLAGSQREAQSLESQVQRFRKSSIAGDLPGQSRTVEQAETLLANYANDPEASDPTTELGQRLAVINRQHAAFLAAHPDYRQAVTALETAKVEVQKRTAAMQDRRSAAIALGTGTAPAIAALAPASYQDTASARSPAGETTADHVQVAASAIAARNGSGQLDALPETMDGLRKSGVAMPDADAQIARLKDPQALRANLEQARAGQKPYKLDAEDRLSFDPLDPIGSVRAAEADGLLNAAQSGDLEERLAPLQKHADELRDLQNRHPELAKLLAGLHGVGLGAAAGAGFLAGAAAGNLSGVNETISAFTGPAAPLTMGGLSLVEGMIGAGVSTYVAHKAGKIVDHYTDALKPFENSAELHPSYDAAGNFIGLLATGGLGSSIRNLVRAGSQAAETGGTGAAVKAVAGRLIGGAAGGAAFEGAVRPGIDLARNAAADALHLKHDPFQRPTAASIAQSAVQGLLLSGNSVESPGGGAPEAPSNPVAGGASKNSEYRESLSRLDDLAGAYRTAGENQDFAAQAAFVDQATATRQRLHELAGTQLSEIPDDESARLGKVVDATTDVPSVRAVLRDNSDTAFGAQAIGADPEVRRAYLNPGREEALAKLTDGDPARTALANRFIGMTAGRDLWRIASGEITPEGLGSEKVRVLQELGLLGAAADSTAPASSTEGTEAAGGGAALSVTDDGLRLMTPNQQMAIRRDAEQGGARYRLNFTPGTPQSAFAAHVSRGMDLGADLFQDEEATPAPVRHTVALTFTPEGADEPVTRSMEVLARSGAEAVAKATGLAQRLGNVVHDAQPVSPEPAAAGSGTPSEAGGGSPALPPSPPSEIPASGEDASGGSYQRQPVPAWRQNADPASDATAIAAMREHRIAVTYTPASGEAPVTDTVPIFARTKAAAISRAKEIFQKLGHTTHATEVAAPPDPAPSPSSVQASPRSASWQSQASPKLGVWRVPRPRDNSPAARRQAPVSSALWVQNSHPLMHVFTPGILAMDEVHDDGTLPPTIVNSQVSKGNAAEFRPSARQAFGIGVSNYNPHPALSLVHEAGHLLDHQILGDRGTYASREHPSFAAWRTAVDDSDALAGVLNANLDDEQLGYYISYPEIFARSYAQWIAQRSGNRQLLRDLHLVLSSDSPWRQWQPDDFQPIAKALDEIFEKKGLK